MDAVLFLNNGGCTQQRNGTDEKIRDSKSRQVHSLNKFQSNNFHCYTERSPDVAYSFLLYIGYIFLQIWNRTFGLTMKV